MMELREKLGRRVRQVWIDWARKQPDIDSKPDWLVPWEEMPERIKEIDGNIGMAIWGDVVNEFTKQIAESEIEAIKNKAGL